MKRANYFAELRQDTTYAVRSLRNNVGFALVIVLSLAIGIGANTAIFTLIDALLLRPLPVPNADQLVVIGDSRRTNSASDGSLRVGPLLLSRSTLELREGNPTLHRARGRTGAHGRLDVVIADSARRSQRGTRRRAEHPRGRLVSGNYFAVLGVPTVARPRRSRSTMTASPTASPVAVISYAYWQRRFAGDRSIIGRAITVNRIPFTVIGVAPPRILPAKSSAA